MAQVLVATGSGCLAITNTGEGETELPGHQFCALTREAAGTCLAIVDCHQVWRRDLAGAWTHVASTEIALQCLTSFAGSIFAGAMDEAALLRISPDGEVERLTGFDGTPGRNDWFGGGPPLGVRAVKAIEASAGSVAILAAVHVGGIPRSTDGGVAWTPTIPILWDVHELSVHLSQPSLVAAATAVGLCISQDDGQNWRVYSDGPETPNSLAVAVLPDEVLFSVQEGPFAQRSQVWRWRLGSDVVEQVRDGLPEWLDGKIDTGWLAASPGARGTRAALVDRGGSLWLSTAGSAGWQRIAAGLPYPFGLTVL